MVNDPLGEKEVEQEDWVVMAKIVLLEAGVCFVQDYIV